MSKSLVIILVTVIVYFAFMIVIGIWASKKNSSVGDFYLGGRKLGPIVTAMSAEASDMSSYLLMGLPGLAYLSGAANVGWTAIGLAVGTYLNWLIVARRLRIYTQENNSITVPQFFSNRYGDKSHVIEGFSALVILIFFIPYTASGFSACGKLFESLFGLDYHTSMIISALVIIIYTSIGGFLAASTTDLIQSIVMTAALIILVVFGVSTAGGIDNVMDNAKSMAGYLSMTHTHDYATGKEGTFSFLQIISTLAWGLGYFGMPHILLRFMAIEDTKKVKVSRRIASIWVVISMSIAVFIGFIGNELSQTGHIEKLTTSADSETIVIKMANLLSHEGIIFAIFAGLIFSGIFACTMSTSDSQLLAASSSMSENIIKSFLKIKISEKASMLCARIVIIIIAIISIIIAWDKNSSIFVIVSFAWAGFGACFGPAMLTSLFWKRSNKYGAFSGMIAGAVMVFVWKFLIRPLGGAWDLYELLPAFIVSLLVNIIVSLATPAPDKKLTDDFDKVNRLMKAE